jgi:hypothetical protein
MSMKRYWKLITVATFIVLTIGTLYMQISLANSKYPEFVIEHKSGNKEELKPLTIIGDYVVDDATYIRTEISAEGTTYRNNPSSTLYFLSDNYLAPEIQRLKKDYRNFMRGKQEQIDLFFEDQNVLAYVEPNSEYLNTHNGQWSYSFEIDVLDQKSKERTKFEISVPEEEKYDYVYIQGMQFINGELKIVTVNDFNTTIGQSENAEIHVYTVDVDAQKIVNDDVIDVTTTALETNQWIDIYTINDGANIGPNKYVVFAIDVSEETYTDDGGYNYELLERQLIAYNLETNEQMTIELDGELGEEIYSELLSGATIYLSKEEGNQFEVMTYNLENQKMETKQTFDVPNIGESLPRIFTLVNDKVYMVHQQYEGRVDSSIMIGDVLTGEVLYEGLIELPDSSKDQTVKEIYINEISVMKE